MSTRQPFQIPRNGLIWLLAAMFAAIAPHVARLPIWVTLICLLCGGWRVMVYRGRWTLPGGLIRALLVFSGGFAVFAHYGTLVGPEAGSALLILGFSFKLLETQQLRDAFIVVILGYFVVAVAFFFDQSMLATAYMALVCILVTAALLGLNQSPLHTHPRRTLMASLRLLGQSLPVMLLLFVLVPRIGPIWSLELGSAGAKTGLSEQLTPGDIAQLSRSAALAFRVESAADSALPPPAQRYWRALVLNHYDGKTWSRAGADMDAEPQVFWDAGANPWQPELSPELSSELSSELSPELSSELSPEIGPEHSRYRYRVLMEPTEQRWLFALAWARSDTPGVGSSRDHRLLSRSPIRQPFSYQVESVTGTALDGQGLPQGLRQRNLQLPETGNPRARLLARQLSAESTSADDYITRLLTLFRQQPFRYTLQPPLLRGDRIDQFLFASRSGFCSHYAGAFVFLMRAAGLPARIVAGYQGGEVNPLGGHLLVHQFDAHAWAEVWLPAKGWFRVDPTAAVAPERVEQGIEQAFLNDAESSPFSLWRYRHLAWVSQLRLSWDYVNYAWQRLVVNYDARAQQQLLKRHFERVDLRVLGLLLLAAVGLVMAVLTFWLLRPGRNNRSQDPRLRGYQQLCRKMARRGLALSFAETPAEYLTRLCRERPDLAESIQSIEQLLIPLLYAPPEPDPARQLALLRRRIRRL
ncbi:MAG: transglutaminase-like putative cysteine protease [Motiliproteus sp.]|jgi:transglutaminase-like putative cysteine protease